MKLTFEKSDFKIGLHGKIHCSERLSMEALTLFELDKKNYSINTYRIKVIKREVPDLHAYEIMHRFIKQLVKYANRHEKLIGKGIDR